MGDELRVTWWDRFLIGIAPSWGQRRIEARARVQLAARHFEAAQTSRRTEGWRRVSTDVNAANGPALAALRELSRDLRRNNGWAKRGIQAIVNNTVSWGIMPKAKPGRSSARGRAALELWNDWADETSCDFDGRLNFYGLQRLAMETIAESGEVLIIRQPASNADELAIPLRLQVLEPDYLDSTRDGVLPEGGGRISQGIECDSKGRRVAYWLYAAHPGGQSAALRFESVRIPAARVLHIYRVDRPGQMRGVPWLASAIARLKDYDDFEDAELMQQKVAACFGAFVTDVDGAGTALGVAKTDPNNQQPLDQLEPGHIAYLPVGKSVTFATPPRAADASFSSRALRRIAVSLGITYEELSGDYSQVNFSSGRMARLSAWQNVYEWREHMLIPQLCHGVWGWAMDLMKDLEGWPMAPRAVWSAPPMPILEPDKEGLAYQRLVRIGAMTWAQMVRELGYDPTEQLAEIEAMNKELDDRGIVLDIDPRRMTAAGQQQGQLAAPAEETDPDEATSDEAIDPATH